MFDHDANTSARACGHRVRVRAFGARCGWQSVMCSPVCGTTTAVLAAVGPMPEMYQRAVCDPGTNPTETTKRHRLRPSECLM